MAMKPASRKRCPDCRRRRIGAFRFCRSCGFDFEGSDVHEPIAAEPTAAAAAAAAPTAPPGRPATSPTPPSPAAFRPPFGLSEPAPREPPPGADGAWSTFAPLPPEPDAEPGPTPAKPAPRVQTVEPPPAGPNRQGLGQRLSTAWQESESVHLLSARWVLLMLATAVVIAVGVALFLGQLL